MLESVGMLLIAEDEQLLVRARSGPSCKQPAVELEPYLREVLNLTITFIIRHCYGIDPQ